MALIHVVDPSLSYAPDSGVPAGALIAEAERDGKRVLTGIRQRMSRGSSVLEFVQVGKPASEILKAATEWPADVIVIGSHGRGGVQRALLGSVAEAVMRRSPCPVLVIKAKE